MKPVILVAAAFVVCLFWLKPAAAFDPSAVSAYKCGGTEPFWNMTIDQTSISFTDQGGAKKTALTYVKPEVPAGLKPGYVNVYKTKTDAGKNATVIVKYNDFGCTDGMSDKSYKYDITVVFPEGSFFGCCDPKK